MLVVLAEQAPESEIHGHRLESQKLGVYLVSMWIIIYRQDRLHYDQKESLKSPTHAIILWMFLNLLGNMYLQIREQFLEIR